MDKLKNIGILTSGGDCPGLNAAIRGIAKPLVERYGKRVVGFIDGYKGLIEDRAIELKSRDLSGILTLGGTILGTSRQPFKVLKNSPDMVQKMIDNYKKHNLDCLVVLGGNGSHKTAGLLSAMGLNIIGLPKTIDNDLFGTDYAFGFYTAVDIATGVIDRIHSTARSHGRIMIIEFMGHSAGWLTLYSGIAGGADVILIPELPYSTNRVIEKLKEREIQGKNFSIIAVAEGAKTITETFMTEKEFKRERKKMKYSSLGYKVADDLKKETDYEIRVTVPGYQQRGGEPSPYDRILATKFGTYAVEMIKNKEYGKMVAIVDNKITAIPLSEVAGKTKPVPKDHEMINAGRTLGTSFGQPL